MKTDPVVYRYMFKTQQVETLTGLLGELNSALKVSLQAQAKSELQLEDTQTENTKLITENTKLITENTKLITENTKLITENTKLKTENTKSDTEKARFTKLFTQLPDVKKRKRVSDKLEESKKKTDDLQQGSYKTILKKARKERQEGQEIRRDANKAINRSRDVSADSKKLLSGRNRIVMFKTGNSPTPPKPSKSTSRRTTGSGVKPSSHGH